MALPDRDAVAGPAGRVRAWQTVWKRHRRFSADGTWDRIHAELLRLADAEGQIEWAVSVDSTINRAHQHATNMTRDGAGVAEFRRPAH